MTLSKVHRSLSRHLDVTESNCGGAVDAAAGIINRMDAKSDLRQWCLFLSWL